MPLRDKNGNSFIQRYAVFDNAQAGMDSLRRQFFAPETRFVNQTIEQTLTKYASPEAGNNTEAYINDLVRRTGLDRQTVLNSFNGQQQTNWLNGVQKHEGWTPGSVKWE